MTGQHTPGPWAVIHDSYCGHYQIESTGEAIAQVFYVDNAPDERGRADARLIAAAPELLEALDKVQKTMDGYRSQMKFCDVEALGYFREFDRRIEQSGFRAAIAKARDQ